ncbi:DUF2968 domain-containing protein [Dyella japonica]|uniref:DUF2968 domain-containing protein n=1 Tax=Dyella japonica TaxID=231455 RepID=UPI00069B6697|nr:DUF2968 domain-containing protein [Dyella japonica]
MSETTTTDLSGAPIAEVKASTYHSEPSDGGVLLVEEDATESFSASTWLLHDVDDDLIKVADVAEVERLDSENALTELRQFRSFRHTVRLSMHPLDLKFYASVYLDALLWRALKSSDYEVAEKAFEELIAKVNIHTRADVRRIQLDARQVQLTRMAAESEARAERLRENIRRNAAQRQRLIDYDNALRNEIKQLEAVRVQTQLQVNRTTRQIGQLYSNCAAQLPRPKYVPFSLRKK